MVVYGKLMNVAILTSCGTVDCKKSSTVKRHDVQSSGVCLRSCVVRGSNNVIFICIFKICWFRLLSFIRVNRNKWDNKSNIFSLGVELYET